MNGDERALFRAQGLHLCWEIKHAKAFLVLGVSGTAGLPSTQMLCLQNRAVTCIPTAWGQWSRLWPATTVESASWQGPSFCWGLCEDLKSSNDHLLVLGPVPWASLVCKKCSSWTYSISASRPGSPVLGGPCSWALQDALEFHAGVTALSPRWSLYWCSN